MKRPIILIPLVAVIAIVAVAAVALAGSSNDHTTTSATTAGAYGSTPAPSQAPATAAGARISTANHGLGSMLVDDRGRTRYLWNADSGSTSTCSGECAQDWPPAATSGAPHVAGAAKASLLGTTRRSDGTTQVTYAGHPLYRFDGDTQPGQTNGQGSNGFGAPWWTVTPSGTAIQSSAP